MKSTLTCHDCIWSDGENCRRFPPVMEMVDTSSATLVQWAFPPTLARCGEFCRSDDANLDQLRVLSEKPL